MCIFIAELNLQKMQINVIDETFTGEVLHTQTLEFSDPLVSVKEIITQRVIQEVEHFNQQLTQHFKGLVQPSFAEITKQGFLLKKNQPVDAEKQVYIALDAFQQNGYFVLIDDQQAESLDQMIRLEANTKISFLKLTPLVGG